MLPVRQKIREPAFALIYYAPASGRQDPPLF